MATCRSSVALGWLANLFPDSMDLLPPIGEEVRKLVPEIELQNFDAPEPGVTKVIELAHWCDLPGACK